MITEQSTYNLHRWRRRVQIQVTVPPLARLGCVKCIYSPIPTPLHPLHPCPISAYDPLGHSDPPHGRRQNPPDVKLVLFSFFRCNHKNLRNHRKKSSKQKRTSRTYEYDNNNLMNYMYIYMYTCNHLTQRRRRLFRYPRWYGGYLAMYILVGSAISASTESVQDTYKTLNIYIYILIK